MRVKVTKEMVTIEDYSCINEGEIAVNKCYFDLPWEFYDLTVTAVFNDIPTPIKDGWCVIPNLKKGTTTIGVYAYSEKDGFVELMYSPNPATFFVNEGSYTGECAVAETPTITEYEKFCTAFATELTKTIEGTHQIRMATMPRVWELSCGVYFVSDGLVFESSDNSYIPFEKGVVLVLPCDVADGVSFRAFGDNGGIYTGTCYVEKKNSFDEYGNSCTVETAYCDDLCLLPGQVSTVIDETSTDSSLPTTKAVYDYCGMLYEKVAGELDAVSALVGGAG